MRSSRLYEIERAETRLRASPQLGFPDGVGPAQKSTWAAVSQAEAALVGLGFRHPTEVVPQGCRHCPPSRANKRPQFPLLHPFTQNTYRDASARKVDVSASARASAVQSTCSRARRAIFLVFLLTGACGLPSWSTPTVVAVMRDMVRREVAAAGAQAGDPTGPHACWPASRVLLGGDRYSDDPIPHIQKGSEWGGATDGPHPLRRRVGRAPPAIAVRAMGRMR